FESFPSLLFTLPRGGAGAVLEFSMFVLALRLALAAGLFAFTFALPFSFAFSLAFLFLLRFGRFSLALAFMFRFSDSSVGLTVSGVSPCFAGRLISSATVCPVFTTSPGRGH